MPLRDLASPAPQMVCRPCDNNIHQIYIYIIESVPIIDKKRLEQTSVTHRNKVHLPLCGFGDGEGLPSQLRDTKTSVRAHSQQRS